MLALSAFSARGEDARRRVEMPLGALDVPVPPRRVVAIDSRISLESALALDLPLVGYSHSRARPWVPVPASVPMLAAPPDLEQILMLAPDLILCPDTAPASDWWPLDRLQAIAPVLPSSHRVTWQANLRDLAGWLDRMDLAQARIADHAARIAGIRARHGATIAGTRVAALYFDPLKRRAMVCSAGTGYGLLMPAQVLAELGGSEIAADRLGPYGEVALESFGAVLGAADALLLIDFGDGAPQALAREPLWRRLPAVRAGRVETVAGNCTFGAGYTADYLATAWQALYARVEA
ncbi:ABC transporter substrate-binding protein [Ancylobacter sonchi]|uniref:ABC transporter substrate-binding protein n=1 Tax=Ancylobacter sonchi TaxID=1937790 RepID=UPI001BD1D266|nr:ABC transporter substrate-binding protein [Ancylobacter sonchi]MBS7535355.1 ABC transporter substrate-binding protein [Ancylobacter sonchi]